MKPRIKVGVNGNKSKIVWIDSGDCNMFSGTILLCWVDRLDK